MGRNYCAGYCYNLPANTNFRIQWRVDEDHDGSTINSVAGRLYILEGMANKHGDQLDEVFKSIRQLQNDGAKYDWELKQLQWLHPELKVQPPEPTHTKSNRQI